MKNKVDINKLIEKKYKSNTLELSDILEEIDLVLNEVADYKTKIANPSDSIPENQQSENIAYRMGQVGNRNPISGDLGRNPQYNQQVTADKIAEGEGELGIGKTPEFQITDLTSLITNSKMQVGNSDRELLDDIVRNMGGTPEDTWRNRIRSMTRYTQFLAKPKKVTEENISSAISSLMILNVFKKLSFFTAQPGKQFEYLMAPLIAPDAKVVGEDDAEIYDIEAASSGKYSIKFYKSSNPKVSGSYTKLKQYSSKEGGVKVIIALVREGHIRFGEAFFTTNLEWLRTNGYFPILEKKDQRPKLVYFQTGVAGLSKIAVYVKEKEGGYVDLTSFTSAPKGFKPQAPPKQITKKYSDSDIIEISGKGRKYSTLVRDISIIEKDLPDADTALKKLFKNNVLNDIPGVMSEITEIAKLSSEERKQRTPELISAIKAYIEQAKAKRQAEIDKERQELQAVQTELEENLEIQEAGEEQEPKGIQFNFGLSGELWAQIEEKDLMINLGDPEIYNKQMLDVSQEVNNHFSYISLIFKKAQELNINVTRYFATSVEAQQRARAKEGNNTGYGRRAIENANEISSTMEKVITTRKGRG